jgi:hypothetical protein
VVSLMIDAACAMVPDSCSGRGSAWHAVAAVGGVTYEAKSRSSVLAALCRELVAAGIPDGPMQITFDAVAGHMTIRSIHKFAGTTLSEGDAPIRRVKWNPPFAFSPAFPGARDETGVGSAVLPAHRGPTEEYASVEALELSVTALCDGCGAVFVPKRSDAKFCSGRCRVASHRRAA